MSTPVRNRIETGVLMSLGARRLREGDDSLIFDATILPFSDHGVRLSRPRTMSVTVVEHSTTGFGQYGVYVTYLSRGETVTHFQADRISSARLNRTLLALDFDGDQALNPDRA